MHARGGFILLEALGILLIFALVCMLFFQYSIQTKPSYSLPILPPPSHTIPFVLESGALRFEGLLEVHQARDWHYFSLKELQ